MKPPKQTEVIKTHKNDIIIIDAVWGLEINLRALLYVHTYNSMLGRIIFRSYNLFTKQKIKIFKILTNKPTVNEYWAT